MMTQEIHPGKPLISIVCPVFNEEKTIPIFHARLSKALASLQEQYNFELVFTNNCSSDGSLDAIRRIRSGDPWVQVITLSRNFGYQASLLCGIRHCRGHAIVIIDVDCEDPPEMIPDFVNGWRQGYDIVYGRRDRRPEPLMMRIARKAFYRLTRLIADYDFILDMAEFSLFSARVRDEIVNNRSTFPFIRAELGFVGFRRLALPYTRGTRVGGQTHYNYFRMTQFAIGGILSSSTFLLRISVYLGIPLAVANMLFLGASFLLAPSAGFSRLMVLDLTYLVLVSSFTSTYLARIHKDGIQRPMFIVDWEQSLFDHAAFERYQASRSHNPSNQPPLALR
jgi:polyisoprenyl-phosphate glycosyltransferase